MSPFGAILRGVVAGAVGTFVMDLVRYQRYRDDGGDEDFRSWEFSTDAESFDDVGAPATVGRRVTEGLLQEELPADAAGLVNDTVHWLTGTGWGIVHALLAGSTRRRSPLMGLLTGTAAWLTSYAVLSRSGIGEPMSEQDQDALVDDLSAHLAYGLGTGTAFWALSGGRESRGGDSNP